MRCLKVRQTRRSLHGVLGGLYWFPESPYAICKGSGGFYLGVRVQILAVLFVSLLGDRCHNRHQFRFTRIVMYIKMLCSMDVPIKALPSNFIFPKSLRPSNIRGQ